MSPAAKTRYVWLCVAGAGLAVASLAYSYISDRRVSWALTERTRRGEGTIIDMAELTHFPWERMFVFRPYTPHERVHDNLGFHWDGVTRTGINRDDHVALVVFVREKRVVHWFLHPRNRGDLAEIASPDGYTPTEARFRVRIDATGWARLFRLAD